MVVVANTAEGGSAGVGVTVGNSGGASGDAFSDVDISTANSVVFSSGQAANGTRSGSTNRVKLRVNTSGTLSVLDGASVIATTTGGVPLNDWFRVEWDVNPLASGGSYDVRLYLDNSTTPLETLSGSRNFTAGGTSDNVQYGCVENVSVGLLMTFWMDSLQFNDSGLPGPDGPGSSGPTPATPFLKAPVRRRVDATRFSFTDRFQR